MIVGVAVAELHVHGSQSLKEKRGVVRSVVQRVRNRFRATVSIAEVGGQDTWQRAQLGLATVGGDPRRVRAVLESALEFIEGLGLAELMDSDIEILTLPHRDVSAVATDVDEEEEPE
jgi:uncharacterized protein YlxP (DUF503 family)